jgi:hypothetical protein
MKGKISYQKKKAKINDFFLKREHHGSDDFMNDCQKR